MKTSKNTIRKCFDGLIALLLSFFSINAAHGQIFTYQLASDSTITPTLGATPTGSAEALTGTFSIEQSPVGPVSSMVDAILSLNFSSANYQISGGESDASVAFESDGFASLIEPVVLSGNISGTFNLTSYGGSFSGSIIPPPQFTILAGTNPVNGGYFNTHVFIDAELISVPEPAIWALMLSGLGLLAFFHVRSRRAQL